VQSSSVEFNVTDSLTFMSGPVRMVSGGNLFLLSDTLTSLSGPLTVSGMTTFDGGLSVDGSLSLVEGSSSLVLDSSVVQLISGSSAVSVSPASTSVAGTLSVTAGSSAFSVTPSATSIAGDVSITSGTSAFSVTSTEVTLNAPFSVISGSTEFDITAFSAALTGALNVTGPVIFDSELSVEGELSVTSDVTVSGGTLTSTGTSIFSQNADNITVDGSGVSITGGTNPVLVSSPYNVTITNGSSCTLSIGSSDLSLQGPSTWSGAVTVTDPNGITISNGGMSAFGHVSAASFSGDGSLLTMLNASNISTGTLDDGRLSTNIPRLDQATNFSVSLISGPVSPGQDAIVGIANGQTAGASSNLAGKFYGDVQITGNLTKGGGTFKIDHPLDPQNKFLYHSFVESPEMMNIYTGNVILDANGKAVVQMPDWFEALNKDFQYQLTCIGGYAQVYINKEITGNQFEIAGGKEGLKVSWQVTGVRHDPYAEKNRVVVEEEKPVSERGTYLHPEAYSVD
jgi:hypothetical protein